jgi:sugar lactone lactonase YvrE
MSNPQLPPIFDQIATAIVPSFCLAEFPVNTFLENIAINAQGTLFVTSYEDGMLYEINPGGEQREFAKVTGKAAGLAFDNDGNLLVSGVTSEGISAIFKVAQGKVETLVTIADAIFLNGMTHLVDDRYLIADSYLGAIWEFNAIQKSAKIWLEHELLDRRSLENPIPAVNGLKIFQGTLYASNTQHQTLVQIPLDSDSNASMPEIAVKNVNIDDFAFDIHGNLYGTTHIYNSVVRIAPDGTVTTIAEAAQGVTGSTSLAFGRTERDRTSIYVLTNGGMSLPPSTGVEPAKVIRLEIGVEGLVLTP